MLFNEKQDGGICMKKLKLVSLLCAAAIVAGVFPGCQSGQPAASAASGGAVSAASTAGKDAPTLTWWLIGNQPQNLQEGVDKINAYTAPKIGVKVDIKVAGWGDWSDKINQIVNSGEKFDIMFTNNTKFSRQVDMGAFADLTDLVQKETPDLYQFIPKAIWKGAMIKNKIYAVPTYKDSSITQYWAFDDTYVKKYNIDVANTKTFDTLDKALTKIKQGEGKSCYPLNLTQNDAFSGMLNNYDDLTLGLQPIGVRIDDKSHKVVSVLEQPDVKADLKMMHKWYKSGVINPDAPTQKDASKNRVFFSAQGFPGAEIGWAVNEGEKKIDTVQAADPILTNSSIQGSLNAISANSQHKTEALKFLQLVNTDQKLRDMLAYGVEGKDFKYTSSKVVKRLTDTWGIGNYAIGTFFDMATQSDAPADQWEQVKKLNEKAVTSTCLGFTPDISKLSTAITNCQTTWDKYRFELMTGASDPDTTIPKIVSELKNSGMDTIIKELQSQIDAQFK
jgi:putative aldouronate transport system substrate-binding protein